MGVIREFVCPGCGYGAMVAGSFSLLMSAVVRTVACATCGELMDVCSHSGELGNFPPSDQHDLEVTSGPLVCETNDGHAVSPWEHPGPCPKCGTTMQLGEGMILAD